MLGSRPRHDKSRITAAGAMLFALVVCGFCYDVAGPAAAQNWPTRPLTTVVPFAPGGGTDVLGRIVGRRLSEVLGQQVIIENVGGAGGMVGSARVVKAALWRFTVAVAPVSPSNEITDRAQASSAASQLDLQCSLGK